MSELIDGKICQNVLGKQKNSISKGNKRKLMMKKFTLLIDEIT